MGKFYPTQAIAITTLLMALGACNKGDEKAPKGFVSPIVDNPHFTEEQQLKVVAAYLDAITVEDVHHGLGGKTAPHLRSKGIFTTFDVFYWRAQEDGLDFALRAEIGSTKDELEIQDIKFKWAPGFRLGAGYLFGQHDEWDIYFNWTWYRNKAHGDARTTDTTTRQFFPAWFPQFLGRYANRASGKWKLNYDTIDVELGRDYFISKAIAARPYISVRGAIVDQDYHAKYDGFFLLPGNNASTFSNTAFKAENDYWGVGPRIGADLLFHANDQFGVFGKLSTSLLYGKFEVREHVHTLAPGNGVMLPVPFMVNIDKHFYRLRPEIEAALGIQWETDVNRGRDHVALSLSYETLYWFNQNQLIKVPVSSFGSPTGMAAIDFESQDKDLGMQGVTFKFQYNF